MQNEHSVVSHWRDTFKDALLPKWAEAVRQRLNAPRVSLGLVFMSPDYFPHAAQVLEILQVHAQIPLLVGCSSQGLISGSEEAEDESGLVLGLYALPEAELKPYRFTQQQLEESNGPAYWHHETGIGPEDSNGWLVFFQKIF